MFPVIYQRISRSLRSPQRTWGSVCQVGPVSLHPTTTHERARTHKHTPSGILVWSVLIGSANASLPVSTHLLSSYFEGVSPSDCCSLQIFFFFPRLHQKYLRQKELNSKFYRPHSPPLISSTPYASCSVSPNPSIFPPPPSPAPPLKKNLFFQPFFFFFFCVICSHPPPRFNHLIHLGSLVRDRWPAATKKKNLWKCSEMPNTNNSLPCFPFFQGGCRRRRKSCRHVWTRAGNQLYRPQPQPPTHLAAGNKTFKRPTCEPT